MAKLNSSNARIIKVPNKYFAAYWIEAGNATGAKMISTGYRMNVKIVAEDTFEYIYSNRFYKPTKTSLILVRLKDSEVEFFDTHIRDGKFLQAGHILVRSLERQHGYDQAVEISSELFFKTLNTFCLDTAA